MSATTEAVREPPANYGPYASEEAALNAVVERLVRGLQPRAVYLFGSRAERRARPDSDFDLVVVLDDDAAGDHASYEGVYAPLCGSEIGCDVVPCLASEFEEVLHDPTNPWHAPWRRARKLYERA
ncbi:MAG TPA: nucleotidyltransferase domain-containing protein [Polyangiaceae bacterium]|nr:nucleotidyltransferase domain-containing protein [Polyangiaceae bacterium]